MDGISFPLVYSAELENLNDPFNLDEIEAAVLNNFNFIKEFWVILKGDLGGMFDEFFENAKLPKGMNSYFLVLVPKISCPQRLTDYKPISLLGCLYKILAKVLASRLKKALPNLISNNQSAFLSGRLILDGVVIINKVVDDARKRKKDCLIFKVDFEKAYDTVNWNFLDYMMIRLGLGDKWRAWIKECIFRGELYVLVDGGTTEEVNIEKGLKQGDHLAPFLFLMVAEGLSGLVRNVVELGIFKGYKVGNGG